MRHIRVRRLLYHCLLHPRLDVVEDEFACHTRNRLFACRIDIGEHNLIEIAESGCEVLIEIAGASVEVRLKHNRNLTIRINLAQTLGTHEDLLGVMTVVGKENMARCAHLEIEPTVDSLVSFHSTTDLFGSTTVELGECHSGNTILDIDWYGLPEFHILDILYRRNEVESNLAVVDTDTLGMEVARIAAVGIGLDTILDIGFHLQAGMDDESTSWLDELRIVAEALEISLLSAVDIEVVGVGGSDNAHPRTQPVEAAVELIGLYNDVIAAVGENIVCAIVLRDTTEESVAVDMTLVHDMGAHRRRSSLSVGSCHAKSFVSAC